MGSGYHGGVACVRVRLMYLHVIPAWACLVEYIMCRSVLSGLLALGWENAWSLPLPFKNQCIHTPVFAFVCVVNTSVHTRGDGL